MFINIRYIEKIAAFLTYFARLVIEVLQNILERIVKLTFGIIRNNTRNFRKYFIFKRKGISKLFEKIIINHTFQL